MIYPFADYGSRRDPSEKPFLLQRVSAAGTQRRCQGVTNGAIVIHTQRLKSDPGGNLLS